MTIKKQRWSRTTDDVPPERHRTTRYSTRCLVLALWTIAQILIRNNSVCLLGPVECCVHVSSLSCCRVGANIPRRFPPQFGSLVPASEKQFVP